jgi:hypothetical protein
MKFYGVQPSEFWGLDSDELGTLGEWMNRYQRAQEEASKS